MKLYVSPNAAVILVSSLTEVMIFSNQGQQEGKAGGTKDDPSSGAFTVASRKVF